MIEVTRTAKKTNLVDVSAVRTALGLVDSSDDVLLRFYVDRASDIIARYCNRVFAAEGVVESIRPDRFITEIILSRYPVQYVTSIAENGLTIPSTEYETNRATGMVTRLYNDRPCWWRRGVISVTYTAGYDLPRNCPGALAHACIQLVKAMYLGADRDPMTRSESVDNLSSATFDTASAGVLPHDVRAVLNGFRNLRVR